jgi:hypothetical protein
MTFTTPKPTQANPLEQLLADVAVLAGQSNDPALQALATRATEMLQTPHVKALTLLQTLLRHFRENINDHLEWLHGKAEYIQALDGPEVERQLREIKGNSQNCCHTETWRYQQRIAAERSQY